MHQRNQIQILYYCLFTSERDTYPEAELPNERAESIMETHMQAVRARVEGSALSLRSSYSINKKGAKMSHIYHVLLGASIAEGRERQVTSYLRQ